MPRVLEAVCQELGTKTKYLFFYYTTVSSHQIVKRSLGIISIDDIMKEGKGRTQRLTVTWWMDGDMVQLDPKIGCYSYGCKQGTRNESYTPQKIRKGQSQSLVFWCLHPFHQLIRLPTVKYAVSTTLSTSIFTCLHPEILWHWPL